MSQGKGAAGLRGLITHSKQTQCGGSADPLAVPLSAFEGGRVLVAKSSKQVPIATIAKQPKARKAAATDRAAASKTGPREPRRRGRPPGSVSLKPGTTDTIVGLIHKGVPLEKALRMAGVPLRTHYEYLSRGQGRHERGSTPALRDYAERVGRAMAESIGVAESKLFEANIRYWLQRRDLEQRGDGQGGLSERAALSLIGDEELAAECSRMLRTLLEDSAIVTPPCPDSDCRCPWHEAMASSDSTVKHKDSGRANGRKTR